MSKIKKNKILYFAIILILSLLLPLTASALETGKKVENFTLKTITGEEISLDKLQGKVVVLEWFNQGCPFVQKHYKNKDMQGLQDGLVGKGAVWLSINSTTKEHKDFLNEADWKKYAEENAVKNAKLILDETGVLGKKFGAKATPHMFVIDQKGVLAYQGAIDDNDSPSADPKTSVNFVKKAVEELLANKPVSKPETKAYGCGVKYQS